MRIFLTLFVIFSLLLCFASTESVTELDSEINATATATATATTTELNNTGSKEDSFDDMIDRALEKEFNESDQNEAAVVPGSLIIVLLDSRLVTVFLKSVVLETVARVKNKKNEIKEEKLISDLVVVIVSATYSGIAFACAGQLVITGYLLARSVIGPGGYSFVSEMVETMAQFGVIFLLFALGLEFSMTKLRVVRAVAILGGLLQISLFMCLCGIIASVRLIVMKMIRFIGNKSTFVPKLVITFSSCDISDDIP
ncbi:hypothetical protein WN944_001105 [Citrus x changshan-huyou]|uniref:Cation/H+ exchanger transmembrane domain-containing protein n=1 Tax=Citrus x changshan-huyou TaxID=2935761 RepID=A0AAP0MFV7_9ROSI